MAAHKLNPGLKVDGRGTSPGPWVLAASVMTLVLFALSAYYVEETVQVGSSLTRAYLEGEALRDLIDRRRQDLSLTAMMLVTTQDVLWMERHHRIERDLLASVSTAIDNPQPGYDVEALRDIRQAVHGLSRVETDAFQMAGSGDADGALALLSGGGYQIWTDQYTRSSQQFISSFLAYLNSELAAHQREEFRSLGVALAVVIVCLSMWIYLARRVRKWSNAFRDEQDARIRLERDLMQAQKMEAVGRLASGIAHDFSNLLTAIRGYATLARERLTPDNPARISLARVEEAADHADAITRQLLIFSRDSVAEKKPVDLVRVLREGANWLQRVLPGTIRLKMDFRNQSHVWVYGDRSQLQQIFLNLVVNARDAMPNGGEVTISIDPLRQAPGHDQRVEVRVSDTGSGMEQSVVDRAVEPFFTTKKSGEGTGLGLSVVHGIVSDHGGDMRIDSRPGLGTTILISFPVTEAGESEPGIQQQEVAGTGSGTVFVAQGDMYVRDIMVTALEDAGFQVLPVETCPAFRSLYKEGQARPDLIVLDADLPGGCGINCLKKIRDYGYHGPAILVTHELSPDMERLLDGDAMVLHKPVRIGDLRRLAAAMTRARVETGAVA